MITNDSLVAHTIAMLINSRVGSDAKMSPLEIARLIVQELADIFEDSNFGESLAKALNSEFTDA